MLTDSDGGYVRTGVTRKILTRARVLAPHVPFAPALFRRFDGTGLYVTSRGEEGSDATTLKCWMPCAVHVSGDDEADAAAAGVNGREKRKLQYRRD